MAGGSLEPLAALFGVFDNVRFGEWKLFDRDLTVIFTVFVTVVSQEGSEGVLRANAGTERVEIAELADGREYPSEVVDGEERVDTVLWGEE